MVCWNRIVKCVSSFIDIKIFIDPSDGDGAGWHPTSLTMVHGNKNKLSVFVNCAHFWCVLWLGNYPFSTQLCKMNTDTHTVKLSMNTKPRLSRLCFRNLTSTSAMENWKTNSGLEKVPISPWLVTLLHICGVIPMMQLPISPETLHERRYRHPKRQCLRIKCRYRRIEWRVFHNVLRVSWCFTSGSWCFTSCSRCIKMFYKCFMMFYYV